MVVVPKAQSGNLEETNTLVWSRSCTQPILSLLKSNKPSSKYVHWIPFQYCHGTFYTKHWKYFDTNPSFICRPKKSSPWKLTWGVTTFFVCISAKHRNAINKDAKHTIKCHFVFEVHGQSIVFTFFFYLYVLFVLAWWICLSVSVHKWEAGWAIRTCIWDHWSSQEHVSENWPGVGWTGCVSNFLFHTMYFIHILFNYCMI